MPIKQRSASGAAPPALPQPGFRSGAVARMASMPVSTLRIWEQRYRAVEPCTTPSGHRLYSTADLERVTLMRRLTRHGHAIGSLAGWTTDQLREAAQTLTPAQNLHLQGQRQPRDALRVVVVGQAMALRLERLQLRQVLTRPLVLVGVYETLAAATQAGHDRPATPSPVRTIDLMLVQLPDLPVVTAARLLDAQRSWQARTVAVSYRFTHAQVRKAFLSAGVELVREHGDDEALATWLDGLSLSPDDAARDHGRDAQGVAMPAWSSDACQLLQSSTLPAPRYDDTALTALAGMSSRVACECPRHVAELLMQIGSFERYSAGCAHLRPGDAALHAQLQQVAGVARVLLETALQRLAQAEGLAWP
ncbi:MAG: MerR family transcriptional regulator [Hydrogenophaga sp.]|nr:MerR family transcriptional regulator [Hydrogenophaga sp.]